MAIASHTASGTGDITVVAVPATLMGFIISESAGTSAAATANIHNGTSTAGGIVAHVDFPVADSDPQAIWFGDEGVYCHDGIFVDRATGSVTVTVYYR